MARRPKHPNKEIERAIKYAEIKGWRYIKAGNSAHAWGRLYCPCETREGCMMSIWSTPRDTQNHASRILNMTRKCEHKFEHSEVINYEKETVL